MVFKEDKMKFKTAIEQVRKYKYYITYADFGEALGLSLSAVKKRIARDSDLKYDEAFVLAKTFELPTKLFFYKEHLPDVIPIEYWDEAKIRLERCPDMPKFYLDFAIALDYNPNFDKDDFRIICMRGDKLNGGHWRCKDGDVLLLDITKKDIAVPGCYAYECEDGNYVSMAYIQKLPSGDVSFKYTNPVSEEVRSQDFLKEVKFKVIGRVIKNIMFFA